MADPRMNQSLRNPLYMRFPFRVDAGGSAVSGRAEHVKETIYQLLLTAPGERVFRPDFGAGAKALVFEPNDAPQWELARQRIVASLAEALRGEVDPRSIEVDVRGDEAALFVEVRFRLAAVGGSQLLTRVPLRGARG